MPLGSISAGEPESLAWSLRALRSSRRRSRALCWKQGEGALQCEQSLRIEAGLKSHRLQ